MFHHLNRDEKKQSLDEIRRVLRPGGSLHLLDFGGPHERSDHLIARLLHRRDRLRDNSVSTILALMQKASSVDPRDVTHQHTIFGRIFFYRGSRASSGNGAA
jgi:ubiquinone/menaquinone biosynthesis C-methylase UbiE